MRRETQELLDGQCSALSISRNTFTWGCAADLEFVAAHRTDANRLGVATQLCFLRHPGRAWTPVEIMPAAMLRFIALQVDADPADLASYAERDQTRREHAVEV